MAEVRKKPVIARAEEPQACTSNTEKKGWEHLIPYAQQIADAPLDAVPQFSWGSAVLAATSQAGTLAGCPLLLMLWSFERFDIGRPELSSYEDYEEAMYQVDAFGNRDPIDAPTMGSIWTKRNVRRLTYPGFVAAFDQLRPERVRWTPYTPGLVADRASLGLSHLCYRDSIWWYTKKCLLFDIFFGASWVVTSPSLYLDSSLTPLTYVCNDVGEELFLFADRVEADPPRIARTELASGLRRLAQRAVQAVKRASCMSTRDPVVPPDTMPAPWSSTTGAPSRARGDWSWQQSAQTDLASGSSGSFFQDDWMLPEGFDNIGLSQMPGAPPPTQPTQHDYSTPVQERPNRGQPPQRFTFPSNQFGKRGRPLCDYLQWFDTAQSDEDKAHVEQTARWARERYQRMKQEEEQEAKRKQEQEEIRIRRENIERQEAEARETDRERKRERARRAKEAGPEAIRKGKYPRCTQ
ncbi:hypothetical protein HU200_057118 [Digitaria exilis]|uniref:Aminotransferase-like plant mobile domain-containing protein n=1 Tax=Digitaria exilis TaxID=1010633 RepID=A0A835E1M0_9POAL|nr:hypothetical protein HU200_057118 [Digitaria exilis]